MLGQMRSLYRLLLLLVRPFVRLRLAWRARSAPAYANRVPERYGHVPSGVPRNVVWVHTVSAGETIAAAPLIQGLVSALGREKVSVLVTTMTPTGSAEVERLFGASVAHCYAPYDFPDAVRRFIDRVQPRALILMETELWPNLIEQTAATNAPVMLVNARMSERSARGYARIGGLTTPLLRKLSWIACQFESDASRFRDLGASGAQVEVTGSIKFDAAQQTVTSEQTALLGELSERLQLGGRPVWIAGSTHAGEDDLMLAAHKLLRAELPDACLLLVPRHPERFAAVAELSARSFASVRLSELQQQGRDPATSAVLVADVMGLLGPLYGLAGVAFVGGSMVDAGGHNPIEPAAVGVPVLMGPYRHNFVGVSELLSTADALTEVADSTELAHALLRLLNDDSARLAQGERARGLVAEQAGATDYLLARLAGVITGAGAQ